MKHRTHSLKSLTYSVPSSLTDVRSNVRSKLSISAQGIFARTGFSKMACNVLRCLAIMACYLSGAAKSVVITQLSDEQRIGLNFIDHPMFISDAP